MDVVVRSFSMTKVINRERRIASEQKLDDGSLLVKFLFLNYSSIGMKRPYF